MLWRGFEASESSIWLSAEKKEEKSRRWEGRDGGGAVREILCSSIIWICISWVVGDYFVVQYRTVPS